MCVCMHADNELCQQGRYSAPAWCAFSILIAFIVSIMRMLTHVYKVTMCGVVHFQ